MRYFRIYYISGDEPYILYKQGWSPTAEAIQNVTIAAYDPIQKEDDPFETFMTADNTEPNLSAPGTASYTAMNAQLEAMRIVESGDVDSYLDQVDKNPIARILLGL